MHEGAIEGYAILELFGHNVLVGHVTTTMLGGSALLRVDVPAVDEQPGFTKFVGPGAIYSLTLVTEDVALAALKQRRPAATVYEPRQLTHGYPDSANDYHHRNDYQDHDPDDEDLVF